MEEAMTDQPLPLRPLMCAIHEKEKCFDCESASLRKLLAEKDSEIASLRQGKQVAQEAVLAQVEKVKDQAETIKACEKAIALYLDIHKQTCKGPDCRETALDPLKQALDRVRGKA